MDTQKPTMNGATIGAVIIVLILILGAAYYYKSVKKEMTAPDQMSEQQIQDLQNQGTSDDTSSIEADLKATNFDGISNGAQ